MTETKKLRDVFEAHMSDNGKWPAAIAKDKNGQYLLLQAASSWRDWQACAESLSMPTEPTAEQSSVVEPSQPVALPDERKAFEAWYVDQCPDIVCEPIGSRLFTHQWEAWQARAAVAPPDEESGATP